MHWLVILCTVLFLPQYNSWKIFHRGRGRHGNLGEPVTDISDLPPEQYFDQKLDHFNPTVTKTWKQIYVVDLPTRSKMHKACPGTCQRYFVNDTFFKAGGPVFLMIGGEGAASPKWMVQGTWMDYAQKYKAYCIMVEHRFYGKSHPTEDLSVKNLTYLSSEQALADLAFFITAYNEKLNLFPSPKWIVMGGSYPGSLAAWMRLKYPHLVHGAVSTSGPLLALADFKDYMYVVEESLKSYSEDCVYAIEEGTKQISSLVMNSSGLDFIYKYFKLCDPLDITIKNDESNFYESLAGNFAVVVQYNKDNRVDSNGKELTIDSVCDVMMNNSLGKEINRLAAVNALILEKNNESCLDYKYSKMIKELRSTNWDSEMANGTRQWLYQTCTEFGFFQTSSLNVTQKMFGNKFPVEFFVNQCTEIFGTKFNLNFLKEAIARTNMIYGGMNDPAKNVVYVHGSIDPWHVLGITETLHEGAPAIYIKGTAHCANMYPKSPNDPPQLISARREIEKLIGQWLRQ